jgi:hypothetical protein
MSRRSGRDPNASSFNFFTGEEIHGGKAAAPRPSQHPFNRGSSLMLGDPDMPDDRFSHRASSVSSSRHQSEHEAHVFQPLGPMPPAFHGEYDDYPEEDFYRAPAPSAIARGLDSFDAPPQAPVARASGRKSTFTIGDPDMADDRFAQYSHRSNMGSSRKSRELAAPIGSDSRRPVVRNGIEPHQLVGGGDAGSRRESSNSWAPYDHQNSGNAMSNRAASHAVAPPGGRNSMGASFGWQ